MKFFNKPKPTKGDDPNLAASATLPPQRATPATAPVGDSGTMPKRPPPKLGASNSARVSSSASMPSLDLPPPPAQMNASPLAASASAPSQMSGGNAEDLARLFTMLLDSRGIKDPAQREQMEKLPSEAKWTLIRQQKLTEDTMTPETAARVTANESADAVEYDRIAVLLGSQPVRWVDAFVSAGGLKHVLTMLVRRVRNMKSEAPDQASIDTLCAGVRCLKAMMNAHLEMSIDGLNETKNIGATLIVCVQLVPARLAASLLEMLAAMAIATDAGHAALRKPIVASNFLLYMAQTLLSSAAPGGAPMQIAALTFLNAMLSGFTEDDEARAAFFKGMQSANLLATIADLQKNFVAEDPQLSVQMHMQIDMLTNAVGPLDESAAAGAGAGGEAPKLMQASSAPNLPPPPEQMTSTPPRMGVSSLARGANARPKPGAAGGAGGGVGGRRAAAGSMSIASGELTIDRNKSAPDNLAKTLAESLRGTSVEKALPKVLQALTAMRTEGAMAMATWALLGAFVGVVSYMPEPDDGVAAPGELVNNACKLLADEFAVPLTVGGVGGAAVSPSSSASVVAQPSAETERLLAEAQESATAAKDRVSQLENELAAAEAAHKRQMEDAVGYQMQQDEELAKLKKQVNELMVAAGAYAESQVTIQQMATEIDQLRVETAALRVGGGEAVLNVPQTVAGVDTGTIRKPNRAVPTIDTNAVLAATAEEMTFMKARIVELEARLAAATAAPAPAPVLEDAPITGGPPPPPPPGGVSAATSSSEDAPITGGPPPPPMLGGAAPPPPPPAPGKAAKPIPKKKDIKPGAKMKAFNWTKVAPQKIEGTVWSKVDDTKISLDAKSIEQLFCVAEKVEKKEKPVAVGKPGDQTITLIDPRRSQNIVIMLSRFKTITYANLREAVEKVDQLVLTPDVIKALRSFVPSPDEVELLKEHSSTPDAQLGKAEQFLREMSKLPRLEERLDAMMFLVGFQKSFQALQTELHILRTACSEIKESKSLIKLLEIMLAIGNYVNGSTQRGAAFGFKLSSIPKMLELRQNEGKGTLLHYIVAFVEQKQPALLDFANEMPTLPAAARTTPLAQLTSDLGKLTVGLATIEKELSQHEESSRFYKEFAQFYDASSGKVEKLQQAFEGFKKSFTDLLKFYVEDLTTDTETFFGGMQKFITSVNQARHDMKVWAQQEVAAVQSAERMKKLGVKTGGPVAIASPGKPGGVEKGSLDNMIASLKTGTDQRMHRAGSNRVTIEKVQLKPVKK